MAVGSGKRRNSSGIHEKSPKILKATLFSCSSSSHTRLVSSQFCCLSPLNSLFCEPLRLPKSFGRIDFLTLRCFSPKIAHFMRFQDARAHTHTQETGAYERGRKTQKRVQGSESKTDTEQRDCLCVFALSILLVG